MSDDNFGYNSNSDENDDFDKIEESPKDNEYYAFLNLPRTATPEQITSAYRKYSRLYHPDKHHEEDKKEIAKGMFSKLNHIYSILGDPQKRAVYDCMGKEGLTDEIWPLITRTKTPKEIIEKFEQLERARKDEQLRRLTNPTSRITVGINATDLFERYMYHDVYDDVIEPSLPFIEISEISFAQTIDAPLTLTDKLTISGNVSTNDGRGAGAIGAVLTRTKSRKSWHEISASVGNGPQIGAKYFRRLSSNLFVTLSNSNRLYSNGIRPEFDISLGNSFSNRLRGFLTYNVTLAVQENDIAIAIQEDTSGVTSSLNYSGEDYFFSGAVQLGIPNSFLVISAVKKFKDSATGNIIGRMRGSAR